MTPIVQTQLWGRGPAPWQQIFEDVASKFASDAGVEKVVIVDNNRSSESVNQPRYDGAVTIFLWAGPNREPGWSQQHPTRLWDITIAADNNSWRFIAPSETNPDLIRDSAGNPVGEVVDGNNIYIYYPITGFYNGRNGAEDDAGIKLFRKILEEVLAMRGTPEEIAERRRLAEERRREEVRLNPVVVGRWTASEELKRRFVATVKEFAPTLGGGKQIVIYDGGTSLSRYTPPSDGRVHLCIWTSPLDMNSDGKMPTTLFSARLSYNTRSSSNFVLLPSSKDGQPLSDLEDHQVGEVVGNAIYIHYPLTVGGLDIVWNGQGPEALLRRMLEEAVFVKSATPEDLARRRQEDARANPVVVRRWHASDELKEKFVATVRELAPALGGGKQIVIYDYCTNIRRHAPSKDGRVHLCLWSSPESTHGAGNMATTLFDAPLSYDRKSDEVILAASAKDVPVLSDLDSNQFGQVVGDTIYLHYPLARESARITWNGQGPEALLRRMLEEVVFVKTATPEQLDAREKEAIARHRVRSRETYVGMCSKRFDRTLKETRDSVEIGQREVEELQQQLVTRIRQVEGARRKLRQMEQARPDDVAVYGTEYDKLVALPKVRDVKAKDGVISVFTEALRFYDPQSSKELGRRVYRRLGKIRIDIHTDGSPVRFFALESISTHGTLVAGPHTHQDGSGCLGNITEVVPQLIAKQEYTDLVILAIRFLETVNPGAETLSRTAWPIDEESAQPARSAA